MAILPTAEANLIDLAITGFVKGTLTELQALVNGQRYSEIGITLKFKKALKIRIFRLSD